MKFKIGDKVIIKNFHKHVVYEILAIEEFPNGVKYISPMVNINNRADYSVRLLIEDDLEFATKEDENLAKQLAESNEANKMYFKVGDKVRIKSFPKDVWEIKMITPGGPSPDYVSLLQDTNNSSRYSRNVWYASELEYAYTDDREHKALGTLLEAYYGHLECDFNWDAIGQGNIDEDIAADIIGYAKSLIQVAEAVQTLEHAQDILKASLECED